MNVINNLPTLTGSEKQVAWANTIRECAIDRIMADTRRRFGANEDEMTRFTQVANYTLRTTAVLKTARWWIDNKANADAMLYSIVGKTFARVKDVFYCPDCETFNDRCCVECVGSHGE